MVGHNAHMYMAMKQERSLKYCRSSGGGMGGEVWRRRKMEDEEEGWREQKGRRGGLGVKRQK